MSEPGRASLYVTLAAFAGVIAVAHVASALARRRPAPPPTASATPSPPPDGVAGYLGPLATGAPFAGHRLGRVDPVRDGQLTLEIVGPAGRWVVDLRARDPAAPPGLAATAAVAIYLRGSGPTQADALAACLALADALAAREAAGARPPPLRPLGR